jgi:hypothetical protein
MPFELEPQVGSYREEKIRERSMQKNVGYPSTTKKQKKAVSATIKCPTPRKITIAP